MSEENTARGKESSNRGKEWMLFIWGIGDEHPVVLDGVSKIGIGKDDLLLTCSSLPQIKKLCNFLGIEFNKSEFLSGQCFVQTERGETALIVHGNRKSIVPRVDIVL